MAAPAVLRSSGPALCPSFAEVCSFLERYGAALDLPEMTFPQMESYMRDTTTGERLAALLLGRSGEKAATVEIEGVHRNHHYHHSHHNEDEDDIKC